MNGASKILTVSYGTFSCTLEGFDDPFNTMKAIAEYFRDLAAEDRYFGAEPPTPDAAMLHRIAEREVQRRVEARVQDNGVILRAADAPAVAAAVAAPEAGAAGAVTEPPAVEPEPETVGEVAEAAAGTGDAPEPVAEPEPAGPAEEIAATEEPVAEEEIAPAEEFAAVEEPAAEEPPEEDLSLRPAVAAVMPEGVAAKLARLRQAVSVAGGETLAPVAAAAAMPEHFEDEHAGIVAGAEGLADAFADAGDYLPEALDEADEAAADPVAEDLPAEIAAGDAEDADAGVLERLGGLLVDEEEVLTSAEAEDGQDAPAPEALAEAAPDPAEEDGLAGLIASLSGGSEADAVAPAEAGTGMVEDLAEAGNPFAGDLELGDEELFELAEAPEVPEPVVTGDLNDDLPEELLGGWDDESAAGEPAAEPEAVAVAEAEEAAEAEAEVAEAPAPEVPAPEAAEEPAPPAAETAPDGAEAAAGIADKAQRARARVIKIRRADALPPVAEAPAVAEDRPQGAAESPEGDMARLMRQADDEMSEPENRRRLAAIQHLKAAVAATVAERRAGVKEPSEEERADPYRADLARAVRPVRPRPAEDGPVRPARPSREPAAAAPDERPAPLVLVSEQRIDRTAPVPVRVAPVRPRRVAGGAAAMATAETDADLEAELQAMMRGDDPAAAGEDEAGLAADAALVAALADDDEDAAGAEPGNIFDDSRGFAEFAERLGATGLPQMLEAAAAYATCVEKRDHFTRPFLMRQVEQGRLVEGFTREDGLRGFGMLLREGRIAKIGRGHFVLADNSSYLAEARKFAR